MSDRFVVQIVMANSYVAADEIVGCWRDFDAANAWADQYERAHDGVASCLVKDLWSPRHPPVVEMPPVD